jgi:general secretion pathway protein G
MKNLTLKRIRAFTLIELLVVILILAVLAALVVPRLLGRTDDAKRAKAAADIKSLETQLNAFRLDCDRYPTTEEGLDALMVEPSDVRNWKGPYIERGIPLDPWQNPYVYENLGNDQFTLISYGADGAPGGEGKDADINSDEG